MGVDRASSTSAREASASLGGKAAENEYLEMGVDRDDAECLSPLQPRGPVSQFHSLDMDVDLAADECRLPLQSSDSVAAERGNLPSAPFAGTTNEQPLAQGVMSRRQANIVTGVSPRVAKHVLKHHGMQPQEYRRHVRGRDVAVGPQRVTACEATKAKEMPRPIFL